MARQSDEERLRKQREYDRLSEQAYKAAGVCVKCRRESVAIGHTMCPDCLYKAAEYSREYYHRKFASQSTKWNEGKKRIREERKSKGLCPRCGKKSVKGFVYCPECRKRNAAGKRKTLVVKGYREEGLCIMCGELVVPGKSYCAEHYAKYCALAANARNYMSKTKHPWQADNKMIYIKHKQ